MYFGKAKKMIDRRQRCVLQKERHAMKTQSLPKLMSLIAGLLVAATIQSVTGNNATEKTRFAPSSSSSSSSDSDDVAGLLAAATIQSVTGNNAKMTTRLAPSITSYSYSYSDSSDDNVLCFSPNRIFTVEVDLFASELGYFRFRECGDRVNPTIAMEVGVNYLFLQTDRSNYYHPMGFAYLPVGPLTEEDELGPTISKTGSNCADTFSCPSPKYYKNRQFLGEVGTNNFGLDDYEPIFFRSDEWFGEEFIALLNFNDSDYDQDIFYFCHIHNFMAGRIKLFQNGKPVTRQDVPPLGFEYDPPPGTSSSVSLFATRL